MDISVWSPCYAVSCLHGGFMKREGRGKWVGVRGEGTWLLSLVACVSMRRHGWVVKLRIWEEASIVMSLMGV
jgi:hypothetical protein